jgi:hypothetical protein
MRESLIKLAVEEQRTTPFERSEYEHTFRTVRSVGRARQPVAGT